MPYLSITKRADAPYHPDLVMHDYDTYYLLTEEGEEIISNWWCCYFSCNASLISGILADWLEENQDILLHNAVGPDPSGRLQNLIKHLRDRFHAHQPA